MGIFDEIHGGTSKPTVDAELEAAATANPELAAVETETPPEQQNPESAPATPEPAPEPAAAEPEADKASPRQVPAAALAEERDRRRQLENDLTTLRAKMEVFERALAPQQPQQGQQQEQAPDPETDPIAALQYERAERAKIQQQLQGFIARTHVQQATAAAALQFTSQHADYPEAAQFLMTQRHAELQAQNMSEQAIQAQMEREVFGISAASLQAGKNPAEAFYSIAKTRGFTPKAAVPAAPAKPAPVVDPAMAEAKRRAATGIAEGGAAPKSDISVEDGANLTGAAFDAWFDKFARTQGRRSSVFRHN